MQQEVKTEQNTISQLDNAIRLEAQFLEPAVWIPGFFLFPTSSCSCG